MIRLTSAKFKVIDLSRKHDHLTPYEREVANEIALSLRGIKLDIPTGLYIFKVCERYGVDHKKIARHLGGRRKR